MPKARLGLMICLALLALIVAGCQTSEKVEDPIKSDSIVGTDYHRPGQTTLDDDDSDLDDEANTPEDNAEPEADTKENLSKEALKEAQYKAELTGAARYTLAKANEEIEAGRLNAARDILKNILTQLAPYAASSSELTDYYTQLLNLSHKVDTLLGKNTGAIAEGVTESVNQLIDEARVEVRKNFEDGKTAYEDKRFEDAISSFEKALEVIRWAPYAKDLEDSYKDKIQSAKQKAEEALRLALYQEQKQQKQIAKQIEDLIARNAEEQKMEDINKLWRDALFNMQLKRFSQAEILCESLLHIDANFTEAKKMLEDIRTLKISTQKEQNLENKILEWRKLYIEWFESKVPLSGKVIEYPTGDEWQRIKARADKMMKDIEESPEVLLIKNTISTKTINIPAYEELTLVEIIENIQSKSDVNILFTPSAREAAEDTELSTKTQTEITIKDFLNYVISLTDADAFKWVIGSEKNGVIWIIAPEEDSNILQENMVTRFHDVRDLTVRVKDFTGMKIRLKANQGSTNNGPVWEPDEPVVEQIEVDDLEEIIPETIAVDSWDNGGTIKTLAGQLLVRNTPEVHAQIDEFLRSIRDVSGLVITLEARFITIDDSMIQDVGIDYRGLGGQSPGNTIMMDDVTVDNPDSAGGFVDNGANNVPPGQAIAGLFFNDGTATTSRDIRGRMENIFDSTLGNTMRTTGGLGMQYTIFNGSDSQMQMVIHALQKKRKATVLTASRLSAFNTQRANLVVINQVAYVRDFSVQTAVSAAVADPIVDVTYDGLVLDVKPTVSNDHRFITIELRPSVVSLLRPIPEFTTTLGGPGSTPVTIQLPELVVQSFETTVMCPDGGLVVVGGFKSIRDVDREATTPIIGDIPILGNLFKRKGRSMENRSLIVILKAEVTDLLEQEERLP